MEGVMCNSCGELSSDFEKIECEYGSAIFCKKCLSLEKRAIADEEIQRMYSFEHSLVSLRSWKLITDDEYSIIHRRIGEMLITLEKERDGV